MADDKDFQWQPPSDQPVDSGGQNQFHPDEPHSDSNIPDNVKHNDHLKSRDDSIQNDNSNSKPIEPASGHSDYKDSNSPNVKDDKKAETPHFKVPIDFLDKISLIAKNNGADSMAQIKIADEVRRLIYNFNEVNFNEDDKKYNEKREEEEKK